MSAAIRQATRAGLMFFAFGCGKLTVSADAGAPAPSAPSATPSASVAATASRVPAPHALPIAPQAKCAAGEVLIQARYEALCSKKCRTDTDCGHQGPCVDTPTPNGDTVKVCEATGDPPK